MCDRNPVAGVVERQPDAPLRVPTHAVRVRYVCMCDGRYDDANALRLWRMATLCTMPMASITVIRLVRP